MLRFTDLLTTHSGTAVLFAGLNVHEGGVAAWVTDSTRSANFVEFLGDIVEQTPPGVEVHCIVDNLSAHSTTAVEEFPGMEEHHHVFLHDTPTHASWLNQVELFLSILSRRLLRHGEFDSVDDLATRVIAFIEAPAAVISHCRSRSVAVAPSVSTTDGPPSLFRRSTPYRPSSPGSGARMAAPSGVANVYRFRLRPSARTRTIRRRRAAASPTSS